MTREEALEVYNSGPEAVARVLLEMEARNIRKSNLTIAASRRPPTV